MVEVAYEIILGGAVVAIYLVLAYQLRRRKGRTSPVPGARQAFALLERELRRAQPSLPSGFTWREAVGEAQKLGVDADWPEVGREVSAYEAYRYGGEREPAEFTGVLALASRLRSSR
jgi:hypothetical protein